MAGQYKDDLTEITSGATGRRYPHADLVCKHFFAGAALYVDDRICLTLTPVGLALKLPEADPTILMNGHGAKPLRYFENAPIKKEYVLLNGKMLQNKRFLHRWIRKSIEYVLQQ